MDVLGGHPDVLRHHLDVLGQGNNVVEMPAEEKFPAEVSSFLKGVPHYWTLPVAGIG